MGAGGCPGSLEGAQRGSYQPTFTQKTSPWELLPFPPSWHFQGPSHVEWGALASPATVFLPWEKRREERKAVLIKE